MRYAFALLALLTLTAPASATPLPLFTFSLPETLTLQVNTPTLIQARIDNVGTDPITFEGYAVGPFNVAYIIPMTFNPVPGPFSVTLPALGPVAPGDSVTFDFAYLTLLAPLQDGARSAHFGFQLGQWNASTAAIAIRSGAQTSIGPLTPGDVSHPVPEPMTLALLGSGLAGAWSLRKRTPTATRDRR